MVVHLILMLRAYLGSSSLSYFGVSDQKVSDTIVREYTGVVVAMLGRVTCSHLLLGALMGICAGRIISLMGLWRHRQTFWGKTLGITACVLLWHGLFMAASMAHYPQLYVEAFDHKGGVAAFLQRFICSTTSPAWWIAFLAGFAVLWLLLELRLAIKSRFSVTSVTGLVLLILVLSGGLIAAELGFGRGLALSPTKRAKSLMDKRGAGAPPNILIIGVDSLRADRLAGAENDPRPVSPTMTRLAREGTTFTQAYSVLPRTFPSWVSMLTGLYPHHHQIEHMFPTAGDRSSLPPAVPQLLAQKGYTTVVVADFAGDMFSRVDLGFQHVQAPYFNFPTLIRQRILELDYHLLPYVANRTGRRLFPVIEEFAHNADPELLTDKVLATLSGLPEPWLLLVFYSTAHFPYAAPSPYYKMFTDPLYKGPYTYYKPHDMVDNMAGKGQSAADIRQVRDLYDGAVRAIDDQVGRLVTGLETRSGLLDRTVVVITADHGENLYDGQLGMGHGDHLFGEPSLRIPLIFWNRTGTIPAGRICQAVVPNIDLAPTLLDIAGLEKVDVPTMDGASLTTYWQSGTNKGHPGSLHDPGLAGEDRPVLLETGIWFSEDAGDIRGLNRIAYPPLTELVEIDPGTNHEVVLKKSYGPVVELAKHRALYQDGRKLIYIPTKQGAHWLLFNPVADPMNEHDLVHAEPATAAWLKARLLSLLSDGSAGPLDGEYVIPRRAADRTLEPRAQPQWLNSLHSREILQP